MVLCGKRVLVVEDEPLIALDLETAIKDGQGIVIGPASCLADALRLADLELIDGAIIDLRLQEEVVTDVILRLRQRGVPCVIYTGQAESTSTKSWPDIPVIDKPALPETVIVILAGLMEKADHR